MAEGDAALEGGAHDGPRAVPLGPARQLQRLLQALERRLEDEGRDGRLAALEVLGPHRALREALVRGQAHAPLRPLRELLPGAEEAAGVLRPPHGLLEVLRDGHGRVREAAHEGHRLVHSPRLVGVQPQPRLRPLVELQELGEPVRAARVLRGVLADLHLHHGGAAGRLAEVLLPRHERVHADGGAAAEAQGGGRGRAEVRGSRGAPQEVQDGHLEAGTHRGQQSVAFRAVLRKPLLHAAAEARERLRQPRRRSRPGLEHRLELRLRLRQRLLVELRQRADLAEAGHGGSVAGAAGRAGLQDDEHARAPRHGVPAAEQQGRLEHELHLLGPGRQQLQLLCRRGRGWRHGALGSPQAEVGNLLGALLHERVARVGQ
mmetsp:Transcript_46229/g.142966  ORF Transcript_46229/g.142966 Transcript_46229/m.142966 type:complete len:375 (+) Transcript_46229:311-1435(+)